MATASVEIPGFQGVRFVSVASRQSRRAEGNVGIDYQVAFDVTLPSGATVRRLLSIPDFELHRAQGASGRLLIRSDIATGIPEADEERITSLFLRKINIGNISLEEISVGLEDLKSVLGNA